MFPGYLQHKTHQRTNVQQEMPSLYDIQSIRTSLAIYSAPEPIGSENKILSAGTPFDTDAMNDHVMNCNIEEHAIDFQDDHYINSLADLVSSYNTDDEPM